MHSAVRAECCRILHRQSWSSPAFRSHTRTRSPEEARSRCTHACWTAFPWRCGIWQLPRESIVPCRAQGLCDSLHIHHSCGEACSCHTPRRCSCRPCSSLASANSHLAVPVIEVDIAIAVGALGLPAAVDG